MGRRLRGLITTDFRLFASPLGRAQASAHRIAAELGTPEITLDPRLMEIGMGAWDGLDDIEIEAEFPGARDGLSPGEWFFPVSYTHLDVYKRQGSPLGHPG